MCSDHSVNTCNMTHMTIHSQHVSSVHVHIDQDQPSTPIHTHTHKQCQDYSYPAWPINSTGCDEHFQSFLFSVAWRRVHGSTPPWRLNESTLSTCTVNGDEVNVTFCCQPATLRLTVPSLRNGVTIFAAVFCLELATAWRYVCPEDMCKVN